MPFPRWLAGMRITADRLDDRNMQTVEQGEDITVTSSTTLIDTNLILPGEVGATYWYHAMISYSAASTPDFQWAWDVPSGANVRRFTTSKDASSSEGVTVGGPAVMRTPATTTGVEAGGSDPDGGPYEDFIYASDEGVITIGGTAGNCTVQFAQNTSDVNETIIRSQSRLVYMRIG